jgi:hypothetical protein
MPAAQRDLTASFFSVEVIHFRTMLFYNLKVAYISYIVFYFTKTLNFAIASATNYDMHEQD